MGNNEAVKIHVFVAALVFSRRIFAKAYPAKNQTAWLDGIKSAFFSSRRVRERLSATTPDVWFGAHNRRGSTEWTQAYCLCVVSSVVKR